jgi:hypothetical protein
VATPDEWGTAYARQAQADFDTWNFLRKSELPECQKLHFLQMACEKLSKAYLCKAGSDPKHIQSSHAYTKKNLPVVLRDELVIQNAGAGLIRDFLKYARTLAREIELLSPAVDDVGQRPDNCEYPWEDGKKLWTPMAYTFFTEQLLTHRHARTVLKLINLTIKRLAGDDN